MSDERRQCDQEHDGAEQAQAEIDRRVVHDLFGQAHERQPSHAEAQRGGGAQRAAQRRGEEPEQKRAEGARAEHRRTDAQRVAQVPGQAGDEDPQQLQPKCHHERGQRQAGEVGAQLCLRRSVHGLSLV